MQRFAASLLVLLAAAASGCSQSEPPPEPAQPAAVEPGTAAPVAEAAPVRPNIVLISVDTLRRDHMSLYGYDRDTTPELAKLAQDGARFETAYSHTATTGPSHATMLTARLPIGHGIDKNGMVLRRDVPTLAQILKRQGYQTVAFVSSYVLAGKFGYRRGFEEYDAELAQPPGDRELTGCAKGNLERCADQTVDAVLGWLAKNRDPKRPLFLFIHLFDPHSGYSAPSEFKSKFIPESEKKAQGFLGKLKRLPALYDAEIAFTDHELGRLLAGFDENGLRSDTILLMTADHGEALGAHGVLTHGYALYEEVLRVPLLVRYPGHIEAGKVLQEPVGLFDVMPTLLGLAGIELEAPPQGGRSLAGALLGREKLDAERPIYLQRRHYDTPQVLGRKVKGNAFGVRIGRWKYFASEADGKRELYDLESDPHEEHNLIDSMPERADAMAKQLEEWKRAHNGGTDGAAEPRQQLSEADRKKLRALGYVE